MTTEMYALAPISQDNIDGYLQQVNGYAMLTLEEERHLAERLQRDEDLDAAKSLILSHLRFVVHIARGYSGYGLPVSDLIQEGNIGLMKAVKRFNPEVGVRLVSFAVHWIKAEIHEYVLRNWRIVKVATTKAQRKLFFNIRKAKKRLGWFNNEEINMVAEQLGVEASEVREMESRLAAQDAGFDGSMNDDEQDNYNAPVFYLEDQGSDIAENLESENWETHANNRLALALAGLDERSQHIIRSRWLDESTTKTTLQELADHYQVSAERVRQLEKNAMRKLKMALGEVY